jgi:hypothetical protein
LPGQRHGEAALFPDLMANAGENASHFKQGQVVILSADVMPQGVEQPGQERRTQRIHVAA